jgi:hypothetical protein
MLFDGLDDLVTMSGLFAQQRENDQLQIAGCQHPSGAHAAAAKALGEAPKKAAPAPKMAMAAVFAEMLSLKMMSSHWKYLSQLISKTIS